MTGRGGAGRDATLLDLRSAASAALPLCGFGEHCANAMMLSLLRSQNQGEALRLLAISAMCGPAPRIAKRLERAPFLSAFLERHLLRGFGGSLHLCGLLGLDRVDVVHSNVAHAFFSMSTINQTLPAT